MTREAAIQGGRSDVGIPGTIAEPLADRVTAALRFADVSGFTRLTERHLRAVTLGPPAV